MQVACAPSHVQFTSRKTQTVLCLAMRTLSNVEASRLLWGAMNVHLDSVLCPPLSLII
jgi:hypothetical protein